MINQNHNINYKENETKINKLFVNLGLRSVNKTLFKPNDHARNGYIILIISVLYGIIFIYCAFLSKIFPISDIWILKYIKDDYYFCYLFPLMIIPTYIALYLNWLAMQFFQHN
jgi:hypothetical protein